jgi:TP901-1 family phage major tail protein
MATCNTTQNEVGGKNLILKKCKEFLNIGTTNASNDITITAHGAKVGDIVKFTDVSTLTAFNVDDFYAIVTVIDANTVELAAAPGGTAILADATTTTADVLVFRTLGGLRSKELSFSSEAVDITNVDSNEWKAMLDGAGVRSVSISGSGVYTSETVFQEFRSDFLNNALTCILLLDSKTKEVIEGCFKITELTISGDYDAEGQYSVSAESAGEVVTYLFP